MPTPNAVAFAQAAELIKEFEGFRSFSYPDPASELAKATRGKPWGHVDARKILDKLPKEVRDLPGNPWTAGYGSTGGVWIGTAVTYKEAGSLLHDHLGTLADTLAKHVKVTLQNHEWAAILSFAYNLGWMNFATSTLLKKLNRNDKSGAAAEFLRWRFAQGKELPGLVKRRERERDVFLGKVT